MITSQSFLASELDGAGYGTAGHLMVVVGFTENGDVIANDPASSSNEAVRNVYKRDQFENIWLRTKRHNAAGGISSGSGGVAYVIAPPWARSCPATCRQPRRGELRRRGLPGACPTRGARPPCSFVHDDATGYPLRADHAAAVRAGASDGRDLDDWLADRDAAPLAGRVPLLCYGSNACPSKLTWLRATLGLPGPAVLLRARCTGLAAVWAAGLRVVDDQRPATLAAVPGVTEQHAVWLATPEQVGGARPLRGLRRGAAQPLPARARRPPARSASRTAPCVDRPLAYVAAEHTAARA